MSHQCLKLYLQQRGTATELSISINGTALSRAGALCRFGNALVNATLSLDGQTLGCTAPKAQAAGAWSRVALDFSEPFVEGFVAPSSTCMAWRVQGSVLQLCCVPRSCRTARRSAWWHSQPALPPDYFELPSSCAWVAVLVLMAGFSFGDIPAGSIGELGAGQGCASAGARMLRSASKCGMAAACSMSLPAAALCVRQRSSTS